MEGKDRMNIVFKSFHVIDIDNNISHKKEIPDGFNIFMEDFIDFANRNVKNKECRPIHDEVDIFKELQNILLERKRDEIAHAIATKLVDCERIAQAKIYQMGTNVKKGSLVQALIQISEDQYQYVIAKVEHSMWFDGTDLTMNYGFPGDKNTIWKSAVIPFYVINGQPLFDKVNVYIDNKSKYWTLSFLEVEEIRDDSSNTYAAYKAVDAELKSAIKEISPRDYAVLSNEVQKTMNQHQQLNYMEYVDDLMESYHPSSSEIEKDVIKECLLALPERKKFDTEFKTVPQSITNKRTKKYKIADGVELTIKSDATDFTSRIVSTMVDGKRVLQIFCEDDETYESFIEE